VTVGGDSEHRSFGHGFDRARHSFGFAGHDRGRFGGHGGGGFGGHGGR